MVNSGADIQIDKGSYTRIHNAILEQLAYHDFSSREYACILYLLRMTYGFSRKECQLSNNDFAKATKVDRTAIIKTLRRLVERNVFIKNEGETCHAATWSFNKYIEQWDSQTSVKTTTSVETTTSQIDTSSSSQFDTPSSVETTTSYISAKESIKESKEIAAVAAPVDEGWKNVCAAYESNIGSFTSMSSEMVHEAYSEFGAIVIVEAIKEAVANNKRKWSYVDGILKGWRANGRADKMRKGAQPKQTKKYAYTDPVTGERVTVMA
jgi:phage replication O-like protein O